MTDVTTGCILIGKKTDKQTNLASVNLRWMHCVIYMYHSLFH